MNLQYTPLSSAQLDTQLRALMAQTPPETLCAVMQQEVPLLVPSAMLRDTAQRLDRAADAREREGL